MTAVSTITPAPRTVIEGFHRTGPDDVSVAFGSGIRDPEDLGKYLRTEQSVYSLQDAYPVVIMLDPELGTEGNCIGTVAIMGDDDHALRTIEAAIRALESVRDGLRETGHHDWT